MIANSRTHSLAALAAACLLACAPAQAQQGPVASSAAAKPADDTAGESDTDLAKKLQNPIGDLYSFPFQSNTNFGVGPHPGTQEILNIQPVIPIHVNDDWNVITRTILPVVWNPDLSPLPSVPVGTGPTDFSAFLSPKNPTNGWLWGAGPIIQIPTVSGPGIGSNVWGAGPTAAIVYTNGPWVVGWPRQQHLVVRRNARAVGQRLQQFPDPALRQLQLRRRLVRDQRPDRHGELGDAGDEVDGSDRRRRGPRVPARKAADQLSLAAYYNLVKPEYGANWQWRTQLTFIF